MQYVGSVHLSSVPAKASQLPHGSLNAPFYVIPDYKQEYKSSPRNCPCPWVLYSNLTFKPCCAHVNGKFSVGSTVSVEVIVQAFPFTFSRLGLLAFKF